MQPIINRHWQLRADPPADGLIRTLSASLKISPLTARVLSLRGCLLPEQGEQFLYAKLSALPDPDLLPGMALACERIAQALEQDELIAIHGDYDVDGISGCALLVEVLRKFGARVAYHIPLRLKDGYGLSAEAMRCAAADGCRLVISVDCGVSAQAEAQLAAELGLDLIITDHHQPGKTLPSCVALINPHLPESRFPYAELSGVGVAFFLLIGLRKHLREKDYFTTTSEPDLRHSLDLVALGTIADIVPLTGVNRILVRIGLQLLESGFRPGIAALKQVAKVKVVTSGAVGFRLAPRLNAAGRLEDAALGVKLLLGEDPSGLNSLAQVLEQFNQQRQAIEQKTLKEAIEQVERENYPDRRSIVLASSDWHSGVIGIVASRLVERYHRPTVLIALNDGVGKGSARSVKGFHLYQALSECAQTLDGFGGHAMAAGMTLCEENLDAFVSCFEEVATAKLTDEQLQPVLLHDGDMPLSEWTSEVVQELDQLAPFGAGNPQPAFVSRNCLVQNPQVVGERHLKFAVSANGTGCAAIAFGMAARIDELSGPVDLLYRPVLNEWQGRTSVQLQILDVRCAQGGIA